MTPAAVIEHEHQPLYRVVRRDWADPLDASFSRMRASNRWNTSGFPALYCCCSEAVARAVALDVFRLAGVELSDLRAGVRPQLVEIDWQGRVADMCSPEGVAASGFAPGYPHAADRQATQAAATAWLRGGLEGVVCRSASLNRAGFADWTGPHERWGEVAIFVETAATRPRVRRRREDRDWFTLARAAH
jgi:RES domain-containing protein